MIGPIGLVRIMYFNSAVNKKYKQACKIENQAKMKLESTSKRINLAGYYLTRDERSQILNLTIKVAELDKSINDLYYFAYDLPLGGFRNLPNDKILKNNNHLRNANPFQMIELLEKQVDRAKAYVKELKDLTSVYVFKNEESTKVSTNA